MKDFENVWEEIIKLIEINNRIETISSKKTNVIEKITPEGLLVTTDKSRLKLVRKEWIEDAWLALLNKKMIIADDIPGRARYRSSFIMALLSKLDYVKAESRPNKLYLKI
jgi:hypothetical protein